MTHEESNAAQAAVNQAAFDAVFAEAVYRAKVNAAYVANDADAKFALLKLLTKKLRPSRR